MKQKPGVSRTVRLLPQDKLGKVALLLGTLLAVFIALYARDIWGTGDWIPLGGFFAYVAFRAGRQIVAGASTNMQNKLDRADEHAMDAAVQEYSPRFSRWTRNAFFSLFALAIFAALIWVSVTLVHWFWLHPLFGRR